MKFSKTCYQKNIFMCCLQRFHYTDHGAMNIYGYTHAGIVINENNAFWATFSADQFLT